MTMLDYFIYDVFTDQPFAGNPLAIVAGADDLSAAQMQTIAREFNLSETIFVMAPRDPAHTARVRIFFPTAEVPFAGHPTIGCALHLSGGESAHLTLEAEAGLVPVTVAEGWAEFTAPQLPMPHGAPLDAALIAAALDLPPDALGPHRPRVWQGGPAFLYVPLRDRAALARARPIEPHWSALMAACDVGSAWIYVCEGDGVRARMFSPAAGIAEDPATGAASAIFAAQLLTEGALSEGENPVAIRQGVEMGRPSEIGLTAVVRQSAMREIRIRGRAVPIAQGRIRVP